MRHGERSEHLGQEIDDARRRQRAALREQREEVAPIDVLHRQVEQAVGLLAEVEDTNRVRVVEARCRPGLSTKALGEGAVDRELAMQDLDGDGLVERQLPGEVDDAHRSRAKPLLDGELSRDRAAQTSDRAPTRRRQQTIAVVLRSWGQQRELEKISTIAAASSRRRQRFASTPEIGGAAIDTALAPGGSRHRPGERAVRYKRVTCGRNRSRWRGWLRRPPAMIGYLAHLHADVTGGSIARWTLTVARGRGEDGPQTRQRSAVHELVVRGPRVPGIPLVGGDASRT